MISILCNQKAHVQPVLFLHCSRSYSVVNGILNTVGIESVMLKYQIHLNTYFYYSSIQMVKNHVNQTKYLGIQIIEVNQI